MRVPMSVSSTQTETNSDDENDHFRINDMRKCACNQCGGTIGNDSEVTYGFPAVDIRLPSQLVVMVGFCSQGCKEEFTRRYDSQIVRRDS